MKRVSDLFFYLTLLFLPTQLGKHFWPDFSIVSGIRVDYLSPTIYFTDILILILFILWLIKNKFSIFNFQFEMKSKFLKFKFSNIKNSLKISNFKLQITLFLVFLIIGILISKSPILGFYGLLKFIEFGFFGFYTASYLRSNTQSFFELITVCFIIGIIFESFLGIAHYLNQGSIGGILYFFGEREFNQSTPGIANASINGELVLRPYGTFPHPNVLAGYLTIAMAMVISNFKFQISNFKKIIFTISIILGTVALFITMSRVAIIIWVSFLIMLFLRKITLKFKLLMGIIIILVLLNLIFLNIFPQRFTGITLADESVQMRRTLTESSLLMIKNHPIFGVGLNNFLINKTLYLQPVHNIYLLVTAQTGIVGLAIFIWFISKTCKRIMNQESGIRRKKSIIHNSRFIILVMVLFLGLFDHYFLTLQQGQLLFSFVLGLCWQDEK